MPATRDNSRKSWACSTFATSRSRPIHGDLVARVNPALCNRKNSFAWANLTVFIYNNQNNQLTGYTSYYEWKDPRMYSSISENRWLKNTTRSWWTYMCPQSGVTPRTKPGFRSFNLREPEGKDWEPREYSKKKIILTSESKLGRFFEKNINLSLILKVMCSLQSKV